MSILEPKVAVIIPVYKHSVLVAEAITCALNQQTDFPLAIVIVNDGCPYQETDRVCRDFALAHPEQIVYLYRPNGGLSAARNSGIEFALNTWDSLAAVYMLDADNRIAPHTIAKSYQILWQDDKIGWVYPTINMFGKEQNSEYDYRGEYSVLRHLRFNICEAGSMIRKEVFAAGCRYDESMRLGFEDWEFWWQAIAADYRGQHLPDSGFQYRKRFESMLSNSEREGEAIKNYMQRKHRHLFTHRNISGWEHQEAPRYAIFLADTRQIVLTSDPTRLDRYLHKDEFIDYYHRGRMMPVRYHRPHFLIFTNSTVLDFLQQQKLIQGIFWRLEQTQATAGFSFLSIDAHTSATAVAIAKLDTISNLYVGESEHLIMTNTKIIDECLLDEPEDWIHSLVSAHPLPQVAQLQLQVPSSLLAQAPLAGCAYNLLSTFRSLRHSLSQLERSVWDWHLNYLPPRSQMFEDARLALDCSPVYPRVPDAQDALQVGFILSIVEFGGVEKVALNLAKVFHEAGWAVHLFIFGSRMQQLPEWAQIFSTINFYHEPSMSPWQGEPYWGSKNDAWSPESEQMAAKGLLSWLDVAINFHNASVNNIMGQLRRSGVKTAISLHVHDLSPWQRPAGYTYLTLGYEHVYDLIVPCSHNLAAWCHAVGIPEDKIVVAPNAGGYPLDVDTREQIIRGKSERDAAAKLKVLFLGRFDRQKGLDRLVGVVNQSRQRQLPLEWKLVGKNILAGENAETALQSVEELIEPPAFSTEELNELYAWADVLFLPSYWEGLPLTILEAMRLGVVVCAADVGAVTEVLHHESTGLTIPNLEGEMFSERAIALLEQLATNPHQLQRLSQAAAAQALELSWQRASSQLITKLENLVVTAK